MSQPPLTNGSSKEIVWITGASSGIGRALALEWAREKRSGSLHLVLSSRRSEELEALAREIPQEVSTEVLVLDFEKPETFPEVVRGLIARHGKIDVLVNNAGISQRSLALETKFEVYEKLLRVNALGTIALTQAALPYMVKHRKAQIATVSSVAGKFGTPYRSGYCAAKHALHGYFDAVRAETAKINTGFTVTLLCPGFVQTNVSRNALTGDGSAQGRVDQTLHGAMTAEEFARQALVAIRAHKQEIVIGGRKEKFGVWLKRHIPALFACMIVGAEVR